MPGGRRRTVPDMAMTHSLRTSTLLSMTHWITPE